MKDDILSWLETIALSFLQRLYAVGWATVRTTGL